MRIAQALLLCAVSLDFGLRLSYQSHEPPTVFDRTISKGDFASAEAYASWSQELLLSELWRGVEMPLADRRLLLSMELFAAAALESNDRARFVMAVSALEPLAVQESFGPEVSQVVDSLCDQLNAAVNVPADTRESLRGRLLQLKRESVRSALRRLCEKWFPSNAAAWRHIDSAYALRSELLHEGRSADADVLLHQEFREVAKYLRAIYAHEYRCSFRAPTAV